MDTKRWASFGFCRISGRRASDRPPLRSYGATGRAAGRQLFTAGGTTTATLLWSRKTLCSPPGCLFLWAHVEDVCRIEFSRPADRGGRAGWLGEVHADLP